MRTVTGAWLLRAASLAALVAAASTGCFVAPFDATGKVCSPASPCPAPWTCVLPAGAEEGTCAREAPDGGGCGALGCPAEHECLEDACVPLQCEAERCAPHEVCVEERCTDRACLGIGCPPGTACAAGACQPTSCQDVPCLPVQVCIDEACVDARCVGVVCPEDQTCLRGTCFPESCQTGSCAEGELCDREQCTPLACVGVTCATGLVCVDGGCRLCPAGEREVAGGCVPLQPDGTTCADGVECGSGHCADGRCCQASACGVCARCDVPGQEGTCAPLPAGSPEPACGAYRCGPGGACGGACLDESACAPGFYCAVGQCLGKLPQGVPCGASAQCTSGHCVGGYCCESECNGACQSCDAAGSEGTCQTAPAGTSLSACAPYVCSGGPGCHATCSTGAQCEAGSTCVGVQCSGLKGNGAPCSQLAECQSGHCVDQVCCDAACGGSCDACNLSGKVGTCSVQGSGAAGGPSCSPRVCNGSSAACPATCTSDAGCASGNYCAGGQCLAKKANGGTCALGNECQSGTCADGFCCNVSCAGVCQGCNVAGSLGACTPRPAGTSCTAGALTGQCQGTGCVVTRTATVNLDAWVAKTSATTTNWGNGLGPRLQVGRTTADNGSNLWTNRSLMRVPLSSLFSGVPNAAAITEARLWVRVRGGGVTQPSPVSSCWTVGSTVKFFVEELTSPFTENGLDTDCQVNATGGADARWPGPSAVTTNRGKYEGSPSGGDWISVNLTPMVRAAFSSGKTQLSVRLIAASGSTNVHEEGKEVRKVALHSRQTASAPYLEVKIAP